MKYGTSFNITEYCANVGITAVADFETLSCPAVMK